MQVVHMKLTKQNLYNFLIYSAFTILVLITSKFPFFWDTIQLASRHAHYFYQTGFHSIILPENIDSGHIPTLGIYLALVWKIFGKTLLVSHLSMLPFVWGIVYQSIQLIKKVLPEHQQGKALIILLADATLLAQCTLVSPDVLVVFFFIMVLNHFNDRRKLWFALAVMGLSLSSMRGMMCTFSIFIANIVYCKWMSGKFSLMENNKLVIFRKDNLNELMRLCIPYIPAILLAGSFLVWHYYKTGWIGYHKNMPWYENFEYVNLKDFLRNIIIYAWRLMDFGRLFVWISGIYCLWHYLKNKPAIDNSLKFFLIIIISLAAVFSYSVLLHKSLSAHRYLLPIYLVISLTVSMYLFLYINNLSVQRFFFHNYCLRVIMWKFLGLSG